MIVINQQLEMLLACYNILSERYSKASICFAALNQWIAHKLGIPAEFDYSTPVVTLDMEARLNNTLDLDLLRQDPWDWLGDLALYLGLYDCVPYPVSLEEAMDYVSNNIKTMLRADNIVFDPAAGTGRLFLAMARLGIDCIMAGIEPAARPYRILVINKFLYNLPAIVLHSSVKTPFTLPCWKQANLYNPVTSFTR